MVNATRIAWQTAKVKSKQRGICALLDDVMTSAMTETDLDSLASTTAFGDESSVWDTPMSPLATEGFFEESEGLLQPDDSISSPVRIGRPSGGIRFHRRQSGEQIALNNE